MHGRMPAGKSAEGRGETTGLLPVITQTVHQTQSAQFSKIQRFAGIIIVTLI